MNNSQPKNLTDFTSGNIYHFAYLYDGTRFFLPLGNQVQDAMLIKTTEQDFYSHAVFENIFRGH